MIVNLLLIGDWFRKYPDNCAYVVNNPVDFSKTYVLPLIIVNFGVKMPFPF